MTSTSAAPAQAEAMPAVEEQVSTRGLRLRHLWAIVPIAVAWFAASIDYIEPFDFWWNVKSGEIMTQTGAFLGTDVLVWSPIREPYSNPQWGSQLLFYWVYALSPYILLTLRALIITGTVGLLLWLCKWRGSWSTTNSGSMRAASVATLVAYLTAWTNYGMRPQLFAFLPFVAFLFLLERKDAHPRWLPLLVPIMLFWVNMHGSFFLGIALMGIYAFGTLIEKVTSQEGRKWLLSRAAMWQAGWMVAAVLATLANPYFTSIYRYFFIATNDPIARSLNMEWQAPTLYDGTGQIFFAQLLILAASFYFSKRRLRPTEVLLLLAFGYLSLISLRNVMWWGWVTAPILAANLTAIRRRAKDDGRRTTDDRQQEAEGSTETQSIRTTKRELPSLNWAIATVLLGGALLFTPLWREANPLVPGPARVALAASTPSKLASFLKSGNVPAPVFNYMEWGGYLEWELYPTYQMFIDGRFEARKVEVWKDYLSISRGRADWQDRLDHYGVRTLVLNKEFHSDLMPFVARSTLWKKVYEDKAALIYTR
ncbi:MAG TPA: hypothetical protein VJ183_06665 [Chloroflexia bacterium]|nr:hypothetical protein [Chloroflexia bacterium]